MWDDWIFCCNRRPSMDKKDTILVIDGPAPVFTLCLLNPSGTIWGQMERRYAAR